MDFLTQGHNRAYSLGYNTHEAMSGLEKAECGAYSTVYLQNDVQTCNSLQVNGCRFIYNICIGSPLCSK